MSLAKFADLDPNRVAVFDASNGSYITYGELRDRSNQLANYLSSRLPAGSKVASLQKNTIDAIVTMRACLMSPIFIVPINWHLSNEEARYILTNSDSMGLIASPECAESAVEITKNIDLSIKLSTNEKFNGFEPLYDTISQESTKPFKTDVFANMMYYSSGTTGKPKGIQRFLTPNINDFSLKQTMPVNEKTVYFIPGPLYHSASISVNYALAVGGCVVITDKFDAEKTLNIIDKYKVTHAQFVPTHFVRMLKLSEEVKNKYDVSSLEYVLYGAAPCSVNVREQMNAWWGNIFYEYYGSSEYMGYTKISPEEWLEHKGSVGKPVSGFSADIYIVDEEGNEVRTNEVGYIVIDGPPKFEYYKDPDSMSSLFTTPNGKIGLGDMGYFDSDGYLYLTDRSVNVIISGGVNIYTTEIEDIIVSHPAVHDAAVIGVPNNEFGEEVRAVVELSPNVESTDIENEILSYVRGKLSSYKCPKSIDIVETLPRLPTGKLLKRELRKQYWS